ncbi:unnamed protein product [Rotaria magnacalcarata]|uniref:Scavenger receptor class B member 1 n=1 Tax=Rotaria magnacalcarata TaxID=392030 RepID=A0A814LTK0_9BILA|nr:unnamed protein product [Rotaria magnacalcarata]CAF1457861.1 unnamed protein product [Rotaria magnacalcarata]CAF1457879.1 unnamed protein product [Rotaria magnacalcarata]CAF2107435.1 unnamed protein product [Rotaria magnacalcarata]CAF2117927.1 unnamed protein product [Rotaria magnacalcarata]
MANIDDKESTESKRRLIERSYPSNDIFKEKGGITSLQFHKDDDQKSHNDSPDTLSEMSPFKPFRTNCKCSVCFILSFLGLILGIILLVLLDPLVNNILAQKMAIVQNREGRRFWQNPPATIHRKMYIWHCTNPIAVKNGAIPELVERGPYVYREEWNRSSITYNDGLDRLSYIPSTTLYFDRNQSIGPDDEYVSVINVPLMAMAYEVQFYSKEMQEGINFFIELLETQLFVNVTVKQLMEGYTDALIEIASKVKPGVLKDDKFGILQARNTSYYQNFTIQTGINDITQVAKIITFNGVSTLNYWSTPQANMLNGTDGSLFPPNLKKDKKVYSYSADMCRSYYLSFLRERKDGYVTLYDYHLSADVFNMSREENRGFCGHDPCLGDGVLNISTCYLGVWGFISSPHFFQADEKFRQDVHGMQPNKNKHAFIMSFDPVTSVPFDVNVRLQLSFYMPNIKTLDLLKSVKPIIMPIVWFDDEARLTPKIHSLLSIILVSLDVASYIKFILPSISLLLVTITSLYIFFQWRRSRRELLNSKVPLVNGVNENEGV